MSEASVGWDVSERVAGWPGLPSLPGDRGADACVVGLGASGLAAVEALVARGLSVIGVDAGRVAGAAAGRNGGFLIAGPEAGMHDAIEAWGPAAVDLYRETLDEIDTLEASLPPGILRRQGSIRLAGLPGDPRDEGEARDREREVADCGVQASALREHGIPVEDYDGPLGRGLFLPLDAAVNPAERALAIAARLEHEATLFEHTRVLRVQSGEVTTEHGTVRAPVVIVAVDGQLDRLVPRLASRVRTARLQMVATEPIAPRLPCPVYGRWGYDYAQQDPSGRVFVGGGRDLFREQEWTTDPSPSEPIQDYLDGLAARMAGGPVTVTHRWAAPVGFTGDERALCTRVDEGVVAIGGYSGTGNLIGPVAARAAVTYLLDGVPPPSYFTS
ncbi:FAD-binding oxidoreductase [Jatrophihabitans endophyticus]|uniref:NAD(P)/FAD-dependent oxidoreductase n=1 Tax=Jatrophihabitans endophyticus TaxID=1206085 RepID=UPI0019E77AAC|nr:FAD-dependent oxidoreductase [Jatrophihabitans endophyticus]MBE7187679.1 FAD-binding oxidoreductase [Jatrophihabitans endophyticus]